MPAFHDAERAALQSFGLAVLHGSMTLPAAPLIDCHAHIYTADMPLAPDAWHRPPGEATAEQFRAELAAAGIERGVLAAASIYGEYNDYSLAATRGGETLRTTVIVAPDVPREALDRMAEAGAVGIRLQLRNKAIPDLGGSAFRALLRHVVDLGWHVQLHDDLHRLPAVMAVIEDAGATIVVDHFGRPEDGDALRGAAFKALLAAVGRGRTWVKISADFRLPSATVAAAAFDRLLDVGGPERLMWGSDWPFAGFEERMTYAGALQAYRTLVPDAGLRAAIDRTGLDFYFPDAA